VRFLIDAQLPRRMCGWMAQRGHDARHTLDLPLGNRTPDAALVAIADAEDRILVTKDDDFVGSRLLTGRPRKLWLITVGNCANADLEALVARAWPQLEQALQDGGFRRGSSLSCLPAQTGPE